MVAERDELSELDRRVIGLLATGVTDDVAARRLFVTDRQYRRYVAAVMRKLGATSRFQAGMLAAERGWLPRQDAERGSA